MGEEKEKERKMIKNKRKDRWQNEDTEALFRAVLGLRNVDEARRFFRDLLTEAELMEFGNRWKAAQLLAKKVPYTEIGAQTGLSSTTIARVKRWLSKGMGGYELMIKRSLQ